LFSQLKQPGNRNPGPGRRPRGREGNTLRRPVGLVPALLLLLLLLFGLGAQRAWSYPMEMLVPAYDYPTVGTFWTQMDQAAASIPLTAICDPANGPGTLVDPNYVTALAELHAAGGRALGYVYTSYAARNLPAVEADADQFAAFYDIDGIFVDEMADDTLAAHYAYYADLYNHIKAAHPSFRVVGNPGTHTQEPYISRPTADALVTFENSVGYPQYVPDPWVYRYTPGHFSHLVHTVASPDTMRAYIMLAVHRDVGLVFVTDDSLPNPYDRLPSYWDQEVSFLQTLQGPAAVPGGASGGPLDGGGGRGGASGPGTLRVVPNPVRDAAEIRLCGGGGPASLWIVDLSGRTVAQGRIENGVFRLSGRAAGNASAIPAPGIYLVRAGQGRLVQTTKLMYCP